MPTDCPWDGFAPGTVSFCEARLCAWIVEPANAWSSLAYVLAGMVMARDPARWGGWAVIVAQVAIGVGSFFFHGSGTFVGELVDQTGMYLLSCLILVEAASGPLGWSRARRDAVYAGLVVASTALNVVVRPIGIPLFAVQLLVGLLWQISQGVGTTGEARARYRLLGGGLALFFVSLTIWVLDLTKVVCDPDRHWMSGHAVWHTANAVVTAMLGRFYALGRTAV